MCYPLDREINVLIGEEIRKISGKDVSRLLLQAGIKPDEPVPVLSPCLTKVAECIVLSNSGGCSWLPVALIEVIRQ